MTTSVNAEMAARIFCHSNNLAWDLVQSITSLISSYDAEKGLDEYLASGRSISESERSYYASASERRDFVAAAFGRCQSPIEELFLAYLVLDPCDETRVRDNLSWTSRDHDGSIGTLLDSQLRVGQQTPIDRFKADFTLLKAGRKLAIELDGHDFHERTKEQATRDKSRDRRIQELGWSVFRFSGSELWRAPSSCVEQCFDFFAEGA